MKTVLAKRMLTTVLSLLLAINLFGVVGIGETVGNAKGDVNTDQAVDASDALLALQHSVQLVVLKGTARSVADADGDGQVNATDALLILQYSVKLISSFPVNPQNLWSFLKNWVIENGRVSGDTCSYTLRCDWFGGSSDTFSLNYWTETDEVRFSLHSTSENISILFSLYIPKKYTGFYEHTGSYLDMESNRIICMSGGFIDSRLFHDNYPLEFDYYDADVDGLEISFKNLYHTAICILLSYIEDFFELESIGYTLADLGFTAFP